MKHENVIAWLSAFEQAFKDFLDRRPPGIGKMKQVLHCRPCPQHGAGCVQVITGEILHHVPWQEEDPAAVAGSLADLMVPVRV